MIIPSGVTVTLFKDNYYTGETLILEGPKSVDFKNDGYENWDKQMRSLRVEKTDTMDVNTYWQRIISNNGPLTETIEVGWSKTESKTDERTVTESFT
jgi:hypothetical protein